MTPQTLLFAAISIIAIVFIGLYWSCIKDKFTNNGYSILPQPLQNDNNRYKFYPHNSIKQMVFFFGPDNEPALESYTAQLINKYYNRKTNVQTQFFKINSKEKQMYSDIFADEINKGIPFAISIKCLNGTLRYKKLIARIKYSDVYEQETLVNDVINNEY